VRRAADPADRRRKLLWVTDEGAAAAQAMKRAVAKAQVRVLAPLEPAEREELVRLLDRLVAGHAATGQGS
jgi:DNA-binding MarR family transcriptional regulator